MHIAGLFVGLIGELRGIEERKNGFSWLLSPFLHFLACGWNIYAIGVGFYSLISLILYLKRVFTCDM